MIGIVSYGGYIPRLRLDRMSIYQQIGWLAPALIMVAQGERSMCNWDEDSLTMAVAAARDCLKGVDKSKVDALYLASTTLPFADRLNAGIVATALNLREDIGSADFTSYAKGRHHRPDRRPGGRSERQDALWSRPPTGARPEPARSTRCGSAMARPRCSWAAKSVIAEFKGSHSVTYDFVSHYRAAQHRFDYTWEERWVRDQGYAKIIPEAIGGLLSKLDMTIDDVDRIVYPCFIKREHARIAQTIGADRGTGGWTTCTRSAARPAQPIPW